MNRVFWAIFPFFVVTASLASGQEILVSDPVLVPVSISTADRPAKLLKKELPGFPQAWQASQMPHWAMLGFMLDRKGTITKVDVDCEKELAKELRQVASHWRFAPGTQQGKPVPSACRFVLIFNTAAEDRQAADAPVRIVSGLIPPQIPVMKLFSAALPFILKVKVGENGQAQVLDIRPSAEHYARSLPPIRTAFDAPEVAEAVRTTVEHWTFAPARRAGEPVAAEVTLAVNAPNDNYLDSTQPIPVKQVRPVYPLSLRKSGNRGEVLLDFIVDASGSVQDPLILRSTHPDFEEPAIAAVLQWKFTPGTAGGKPVDTHLQCPIIFTLVSDSLVDSNPFDGSPSGGLDAYSVGSSANHAGPFPYDIAPKPKLVVLPVYPLEFLKRDKSGSATVKMLVGKEGTVLRCVIIKASDPEFGKAAAAAVLCWTFDPATTSTHPVPAMLKHEFSFNDSDRDFALDNDAEDFLSHLKRHPEQIVGLAQLDSIPKTQYRVRPVFPPEAPSGQVLVEFYLDHTGKVRFPHALQSSSDELIYPALTAVSRWQFDPPKKAGKPIDAVAQIPIIWTAKKPLEAAPSQAR